MSYLVLARKYRSHNFAEMVGQDHVVRALTNALESKRLHHAYLFTGTRGVGKTTVSRILAKSLNCQGVDGNGGITANPCGVCQACTDIDSGRFVDYTELDAASNRGVDEVQALLEQAVYKPVQGRFKVFMIDEVHMLTNTAFNAMLKTLEEPPEYLKFVLATTDPQKVPPTVLSRCLQFNLRPMAPETIREHLLHVLGQEGVQSDEQALRLLARAARGSMRDALSLTDQAIAFGNGRLEEDTVRQMLGSVDRSYVFKLIEALAEGDGKTVVEVSEDLRLNGLSAGSTLEEMSAVLQRMAVLQAVQGLQEPQGDGDPDAAQATRLAGLMPADETQLLYSICLHGRAELGLAPDEYAGLTMVLLRLLAFRPAHAGQGRAAKAVLGVVGAEKKTLNIDASPPLSAVIPASNPTKPAQGNAFIADVRVMSTVPSTPTAPVAPVPPGQLLAVVDGAVGMPHASGQKSAVSQIAANMPSGPQPSHEGAEIPVRIQAHSRVDAVAADRSSPAIAPSEDGDFWHRTVQQLISREAISALVRELGLQSQLVARDTDQWILRVERESLNQQGSRDRLQVALQSLGHQVSLVVEVGRVVDSPARRNASAAAQRQLAAEKIIFEAPFVQAMMREFGAKIVPSSIRPA